eukprot:m.206202 g.206202  ORF g.206202 m.206202 type:complete len:153 (+) comp39669_c2_seq8:120-578(+)
MVEIPKLLKEIKEQMENVQEQMKDVQEQMKDMKEQMGLLQKKEEKKKIPEVTENDLESAMKSFEELTMQTSHASVSLTSSARNKYAATVFQYKDWWDQLKLLRAESSLTTEQKTQKEELERNVHDEKKKFETAVEEVSFACFLVVVIVSVVA